NRRAQNEQSALRRSMNKSLRYTIITGANRGIGFWTTFQLLIRGEAVIMACRSKERAEAAKIEILKQIKNQKNKKHKLGSRVQSASSTLSVGTSKGLSSMASEAMIDADDAAKLVHIMTVDLSDAMSIYEFVKQIITENIKIRAIYHNASVLFDTK
ncbi:MAG: Dehydrogenase/reductase SDR member 12, partial [Marteilia pararefringens]